MAKCIIFFLLLNPLITIAQYSFASEPFYLTINKEQEKLVNAFLQKANPAIQLKDFIFKKEIAFTFLDSAIISYDSLVENDFIFMPHSPNNDKIIDLGYYFMYNKSKKQYRFAGGDSIQVIKLIHKKDKTIQTIWKSNGLYPVVDYAIWFGNDAFALLIWNNNSSNKKLKITGELQYCNLKTQKIRYYIFPNNIHYLTRGFWDFYFDIKYKQ